MKKHSFEKDSAAGKALRLARDEKVDEAQELLSMIEVSGLSSDDVRSAALAYSYCHDMEMSERCWDRVVSSGEEAAGDRFMLASTQADFGRSDEALRNLRGEIELATRSGNDYYLSASVIVAAGILLNRHDKSAARDLLALVPDDAGYYLRGVDSGRSCSSLLKPIDPKAECEKRVGL